MRIFKQIILVFLSLSFMGCASYFKRKQCEKTNWFSHGQGVAMQGGLLESDVFLGECRKVEADINEGALDQGYKSGRSDYCKPATVFMTGKEGNKFNAGMCDGEPMRILQAKYAAGVAEYCRPSNGIAAGQSGKVYQNVCSTEAERDFLPEFNKGRKQYLSSIVLSKQEEVRDIDRAIRDLENRRRELVLRLAMTPKTNVVVKNRTHTASGVHESVHVEEDANSKSAREEIEGDMRQVDHEISRKRREQDAIRAEIRRLQTEMATI